MKVWLDSKEYKTTPDGVREIALPNYSQPFRIGTQEQRDALLGVSNWIIRFHGGFTRYRIPIEDPYNQAGKFWDSEIETRWAEEDHVTLPLLVVTPTITEHLANSDQYFLSFEDFSGELYALVQEKDTGNNFDYDIFLWDGATATWAQAATLPGAPTTAGKRAFLKAMLDGVYAYVENTVASTAAIRLYLSTNGTTYNVCTLTNLVTYATSDVPGPMISRLTTLFLTYWDDSAKSILVYTTTDTGTSKTLTLVATVPSAGPPLGLAEWVDPTGNAVIWMRTREGIGYLKATMSGAANYVPVHNFPSEQANAFGLEEWQGNLYSPSQEGLNKCYWGNLGGQVGLIIEGIGLNRKAGVTSTKQGFITAISRSDLWLFVAQGGTAAKYATVFAWDGEAWHFIYGVAATGERILAMAISTNDDNISRLHVAPVDATTPTSLTNNRHLNYVLDNPNAIYGTPSFGDTKDLQTGFFDAGMGEIPGVALEAHCVADSLSAATTGQYITTIYGIDGTTPATTLGNFLSGTTKLSFGAGSIGVAFKNISFLLRLERAATATASPRPIYFIFKFKKRPTTRWGYIATIDLAGSKTGLGITRSQETIISNLRSLRDATVLFPFKMATGQMAAVNVEMTELHLNYIWEQTDSGYIAQPRKGYAAVKLETVI